MLIASKRSFLARVPVALMKSLIRLGWIKATGSFAWLNASTALISYPPLGSRTINSGFSSFKRFTSWVIPRVLFSTWKREQPVRCCFASKNVSPVGCMAISSLALLTSIPMNIRTPPKGLWCTQALPFLAIRTLWFSQLFRLFLRVYSVAILLRDELGGSRGERSATLPPTTTNIQGENFIDERGGEF